MGYSYVYADVISNRCGVARGQFIEMGIKYIKMRLTAMLVDLEFKNLDVSGSLMLRQLFGDLFPT